ncbi:hypothetical protein QOZ91_002624 [Clostridium sardiniense]|nr:hypothetical protein [Clostridium sardiniense]
MKNKRKFKENKEKQMRFWNMLFNYDRWSMGIVYID